MNRRNFWAAIVAFFAGLFGMARTAKAATIQASILQGERKMLPTVTFKRVFRLVDYQWKEIEWEQMVPGEGVCVVSIFDGELCEFDFMIPDKPPDASSPYAPVEIREIHDLLKPAAEHVHIINAKLMPGPGLE